MFGFVSHSLDLLYAKRWSKEQIVVLHDSENRAALSALLCVNEKPLALFQVFHVDAFDDINLDVFISDLRAQAVRVGFVYDSQSKIHIVSILESKTEIEPLDDFMTPGELLLFIYYREFTCTPYLILLPKLLVGTLNLFISLIDTLFSMFKEKGHTLRYYSPCSSSHQLSSSNLLHNYIRDHYTDSIFDNSSICQANDSPFAVLVPYEAHCEIDANFLYNVCCRNTYYITSCKSSNLLKNKILELSIDDLKDIAQVILQMKHLLMNSHNYLPDVSGVDGSKQMRMFHMEYSPLVEGEPCRQYTDDSFSDITIPIPNKAGLLNVRKPHRYDKIILNDINMARQTSYQTQIELATDLKRYLHGFQERLVEVAKNYLAKSNDLYEAGMMDETHRDFEENYVHETMAHIAEVVELINERDIPFVEKYIEKMEELLDEYGN